MNFAALVYRSGIDRAELSSQLGVDNSALDRWLANIAPPPRHIVRAIETMVGFLPEKPILAPPQGSLPDRSDGAKPKLVSLFSGAGGLDIGLENAGFETVFANEIEAHACESLRANKLISNLTERQFGAWFDDKVARQRCFRSGSEAFLSALRTRLAPALTVNERPLSKAKIVGKDIRQLTADEILAATGTRRGALDLIAGGPPCQPFSRAGRQETVNCDDGQLFLEFVRLVDDLRPRWFLFENVKGLVQHRTDVLLSTCSHCRNTSPVSFALRDAAHCLDGLIDTCATCGRADTCMPRWEKRRGGSLAIIEAEFSRLGYRCEVAVLNARDFGVPQDRERLIIVGSRDGERFSWPRPTHGHSGAARSLFDRIELSPPISVRDALLKRGTGVTANLAPKPCCGSRTSSGLTTSR